MKRFAIYKCGKNPLHTYAIGGSIQAGDFMHDADPKGDVYIKGIKMSFGVWFYAFHIVLFGEVVE